MATKIITVAATPPAESSGSDYNKGAPLNAVEFDQNLINLRAAIDRRALASSSNAFSCGDISATGATLSGVVLSSIKVDGSGAAQVWLKHNAASADQKNLMFRTVSGTSFIAALNDAESAYPFTFLSMNHSNGNVLIGGTVASTGAKLEITGSISASTGFGCNGKTPQTAYASGGVLANVVTALINCGILSS